MLQKTCIHCNTPKDLSEFVPDKRNSIDGTYNVCKECKRKQVRISNDRKDYKAKHRKKYAEDATYNAMMKAKSASFRSTHNDQVLLSQAKVRSTRFGLSFNIDILDIVIPDTCPILGIKLKRGTKGKSAESPSLDRIDNSRGYEKGNVRVISNLANTMKNNATRVQLLTFADNIKSYLDDDIV